MLILFFLFLPNWDICINFQGLRFSKIRVMSGIIQVHTRIFKDKKEKRVKK